MCVYIFTKLHITAQSSPVILVIICHSHRSSQGRINDTYYENLSSDATNGTHSVYLYSSYLIPEFLCAPSPPPPPPPLLPCHSILFSRLSGLAATEPTLSCLLYVFFLSTQVPPVSHMASTSLQLLLCVFFFQCIDASMVSTLLLLTTH